MTVQRILQKQLKTASSIMLNMKHGFDGSGSHAIYNQTNNEETNNIIQIMFCPLNIVIENEKIWEEAAPNNPLSQRPLMIQMGKESVEQLQSLTIFNDVEKMKNGFDLETDSGTIEVEANILSYMMELKAAHLYLGVGGAYCDLCSYSKEQCMLKSTIKDLTSREVWNPYLTFLMSLYKKMVVF